MHVRPRHLAAAVALTIVGALAACKEESDAPVNGVPGGAGTGAGVTTGAGGAGDGVPPCDAWEGPFGTHEQEVIDPTLAWDGFRPDEIEPTTVSLADYAACGDGEDVKAIVLEIDALWCPSCRDVAEGLAERYASDYAPRGVRVISLVIQDEDGNPADVEDTYRWRAQFDLESISVGWDPSYSLANEQPRDLPQALIIDPRTMRIVHRVIGNVGIQPLIDAVVDGNTD